MARRPQGLLDDLAAVLNDLPGVFSTAQWGGRAYKVGQPKKPKVLAHLCLSSSGDAVTVSFKLTPTRASDVLERHEWIAPHSFRTLAPAGWLTATITMKRQVGTVGRLLAESHGLYKVPDRTVDQPDGETPVRRIGNEAASRIDQVMGDVKGWKPPADW